MSSKEFKKQFIVYIKENYISSSVNIDLNYYQDQLNHLEIENLSLIPRVVRVFSYVNLFFFNIDPHVLYKVDFKFYPANDYYRLFRANMFKLNWNHWDKWRFKFQYILKTIISYIIIKCILLSIFQLTNVYQTFAIKNSNNSRINDNDNDRILKKLAQVYVANPLSESTGSVIFVTFSLIFSLSQATIWLPYYFNKKPLDSLISRVGMEALREICRIDALILKELDNIEYSIKTKLLKVKLYKIENNQSENLLIYNYNYYKNIINFLKSKFWIIRPAAFDPKYTTKISDFFIRFTFIALILTLPLIFYIPVAVLEDVSRIRCSKTNHLSIFKYLSSSLIKNNHIDNGKYCSFLTTITFPEFITLFELIYGIVILGYFLSVQAVWILVDVYTHILLINYDLEEDLLECLIKLKSNNKEIYFERKTFQKREQSSRKEMEWKGENFQFKFNCNIYCNRISDNDFSIDLTLMKILIKLYVNHINSIRNARFLTVMTSSFIGTIGFSLMLAIFGGKLAGKELESLRVIIIIWLLIMANTIVLSCAYSFSRLARIEKLCYSILAQILIRKNQYFHNINDDDNYNENLINSNTQNYVVGLEDLDFISFRWTKLVHSHGLSSDLNSVKLFNLINITFDRVLQMNFILVTFSVFLDYNL